MKRKIGIGVIGVGAMGSQHLKSITDLANAELVAFSDLKEEKRKKYAEIYDVPCYENYKDLLNHDGIEVVLIATPHYDHTTIAIEAFEREVPLHVLTEKPVGVHVKDINKMIAAYEKAKERKKDLRFGAMFQQRVLDHWKKIKDMVDSGELGKLTRMTWTITNWFRSQAYYDNGGWRGTWEGEGGGVLLNQCPHNLDLFTWIAGGVPSEITGFASFGKYHDIEVEDEVTGFFRYENGMVGHFITSTGEYPGTNCLEVVGENGKLIYEDGKLTFHRNRKSVIEFSKTTNKKYGGMENWVCDIPFKKETGATHIDVIENFCNAVLDENVNLIAEASEGINSITLSNGILLSQLKNNVALQVPFNEDDFVNELNKLIKNSTFVKNPECTVDSNEDPNASFNMKN